MIVIFFWLVSFHTRDERTGTDTFSPDCLCCTRNEAEKIIECDQVGALRDEGRITVNGRTQSEIDVPIDECWYEAFITRVEFMDFRGDLDPRDGYNADYNRSLVLHDRKEQ
jgi:hypothetical protein